MRYKTLFRLGVKWIGLVLIVVFGARVLQSLVLAAWAIIIGRWDFDLSEVIYFVASGGDGYAPLLIFGTGLYLFFRGEWIVNLAIPSNRPYCPECGFDLSGQQRAAVCSECGTGIPADVQAQIKKTTGSADERIPPESEEP